MWRYPLAEVERLLHGLVRICQVTEHGEQGKVKVTDGQLNSTWLSRAIDRAGQNCTWQPLDIGEQVVVVCPSGDFSQGIIIASLYQQNYQPPSDNLDEEQRQFGDGTVVSYDRKQHKLLLDVKGSDANIEIVSAGTLNVTTEQDINAHTNANAKVVAKGNVNVEGKQISLNGGSPCVTTAHICHYTGNPHGDGSSSVIAGA